MAGIIDMRIRQNQSESVKSMGICHFFEKKKKI